MYCVSHVFHPMKNSKVRIAVAALFLTGLAPINAQLLQGQWRDHLSYSSTTAIADDGNVLYAAAEAGLITYNRQSDEIGKLSKVQGLSDVNISALGWDDLSSKLLITYFNGNIDIMDVSGAIRNLPDIERKPITGSKSINAITFHSGMGYLACGFGIVALDLARNEITDTYSFGEGGTPIDVFDVAIAGGFIYAATESGVYRADMDSPNLVDYQYWERLGYLPQPTGSYHTVENSSNGIIAAYTDEALSTDSSRVDRIIVLSGGSYTDWPVEYNDEAVYDITFSNGHLGIASFQRAQIFNSSGSLIRDFTAYNVRQLYVDASGEIYLATLGTGLLRRQNEEYRFFSINGPRHNEVSKIETRGEHVWVSSGGPDRLYYHGAAYHFLDNRWNSLNTLDMPDQQTLGNTHKIAIDPRDVQHVYAGTQQYGILDIRDGEIVQIFDETNTEAFSEIPPDIKVRVSGMDFDQENNLWIVLDYISQAVFKLPPEGTWENPEASSTILVAGNTAFTDLLVTSSGQIWISSLTRGLVVLEEDGSGGFTERAFSIKNQDGNILSRAYCLAEDRDGNILVGTNAGPVRYYSPRTVFDQIDVTGVQEKIPRNDGTNNADYVLGSEVILDIAVDGGNRTWMATDNSGVFLLDDDGKTTLHNFRKENSKMLSNNVTGIGINEKTGEVFFASSSGLVSYQGSAISGFSDYRNAYVYPNPVRPGYDGIITITGLMENTLVKITDLSGNLVWETNSLGGQAIWDGRNFDGRKVASGIYLIMLALPDGSESHIMKLLFMN